MNDQPIHTLNHTSHPFGQNGIEVEGYVLVKGRYVLTKSDGFRSMKEASDYALQKLQEQIAAKLNCELQQLIPNPPETSVDNL